MSGNQKGSKCRVAVVRCMSSCTRNGFSLGCDRGRLRLVDNTLPVVRHWWIEKKKFDGVVGETDLASQTTPMVSGGRLGLAVVAQDDGARVGILFGHRLLLEMLIESAEHTFHVLDTLVADGALVRPLDVLGTAVVVDHVPTLHGDDLLVRRENVLAADGAVAVHDTFSAAVRLLLIDGNARAAFLITLLETNNT